MIILRTTLFSSENKNNEDEDNNDKKNKRKHNALIAAGTVGVLSSGKIMRTLNKKAANNFEKSLAIPESSKIYKKLKNKAKNLGINIKHDSEPNIARYEGDTDTIRLGNDRRNPAMLAHEMGHAAMSQKGRSHDILGKAAHSTAGDVISIPYHASGTKMGKELGLASDALFLNNGIIHGSLAARKNEENDKKKSKRLIRQGLILSTVPSIPILTREISASRKGLKYLKEAGASKDTLKQSRKSLAHALGTYASVAVKPVLITAGGTAIGYGLEKRSISKKKKEQKQKEIKR